MIASFFIGSCLPHQCLISTRNSTTCGKLQICIPNSNRLNKLLIQKPSPPASFLLTVTREATPILKACWRSITREEVRALWHFPSIDVTLKILEWSKNARFTQDVFNGIEMKTNLAFPPLQMRKLNRRWRRPEMYESALPFRKRAARWVWLVNQRLGSNVNLVEIDFSPENRK